MCFKLGAVLVKGGKIISTGYNHHRTHYDGADVPRRGHRKPVSMHAEMHAIISITGMSPSFRKQIQGVDRRFSRRGDDDPDIPYEPPIFKGSAALEGCYCLSGAGCEQFQQQAFSVLGLGCEEEVDEGETHTWEEDPFEESGEAEEEYEFWWGGRKWQREQWL